MFVFTFFVFYLELVYSVSFVFLSFYCQSCFHFHPLFSLLLFHHCFLPRISYVCLSLFSFWTGVAFRCFHHNCSFNKLQVHFLSPFLSSNDISLLMVFSVVLYITCQVRVVFVHFFFYHLLFVFLLIMLLLLF